MDEELMKDQATYGMSITLGGKRIDPASIYKQEQKPVAWATKSAIDRLTGKLGRIANPVTWGVNAALFAGKVEGTVPLYLAPPAPAWTDAHWTEYERGIVAAERERVTFEVVNEAQRAVQEAVATERERIAAWVEDMCADLDAKTIANGIRNGGNDDIGAFIRGVG